MRAFTVHLPRNVDSALLPHRDTSSVARRCNNDRQCTASGDQLGGRVSAVFAGAKCWGIRSGAVVPPWGYNCSMLIGYARVSLRLKQDEAPQVAALERAGCERVFTDRVSRLRDDRPGLVEALGYLRDGDVLVVWKLDRAVSGLRQAVNLIETLKARGCGLVSLTEGIDTRTPLGEALFTIVAALSQIEVQATKERTAEKLAHVRSRGVKLGKPAKLSAQDVKDAELLLQDGSRTVEEVAARLGVSRWTLNRARNREAAKKRAEVGL